MDTINALTAKFPSSSGTQKQQNRTWGTSNTIPTQPASAKGRELEKKPSLEEKMKRKRFPKKPRPWRTDLLWQSKYDREDAEGRPPEKIEKGGNSDVSDVAPCGEIGNRLLFCKHTLRRVTCTNTELGAVTAPPENNYRLFSSPFCSQNKREMFRMI